MTTAQDESFNAMSCKICYDNYDESVKKPELIVPCGHTFCKDCIGKLIKPECPTCKKPFSNTVTVWDLIPSVKSAVEEPQSEVQKELANFKNLVEYIEELNQKESELNIEKIRNAELMINAKAEETINRVIDEKNALLHRVKICKNLLENRKIRNQMIENFAKSRYELITLRVSYDSKWSTSGTSDEALREEIQQETTELRSLKENIEAFIKRNDAIFSDKVHPQPEQLLGEVITDFTKEKVATTPSLQSSVEIQESSEPYKSNQYGGNPHASKLNPNAVPFGLPSSTVDEQIYQPDDLSIRPTPLAYPIQQANLPYSTVDPLQWPVGVIESNPVQDIPIRYPGYYSEN